MKQCFVISVFCFIFLSACSDPSGIARHHVGHDTVLKEKGHPVSESSRLDIAPITDTLAKRIYGWFNRNWVLYERKIKEKVQVFKYHIHSGESKLFFESSYPISKIVPNEEYSYFAVESKVKDQHSIVTILDEQGNILLKKLKNATQLDFTWSPYIDDQLLMIEYNPSMTAEVILVDVNDPTKEDILDVQPYIQWFKENSLAYLEWGNEPSFHAPVYLYLLDTKLKKSLLTNISVFASSKNYFMYITGNSSQGEQLPFHFFHKDHPDDIMEFRINKLYSNSEFIWVPPFDWLPSENMFITFSPKHRGMVHDYNQGFHLVAFELESGKQKVITEMAQSPDLNCSTNSSMCLIGNRYEQLINIDNKKMYDLFIN